MSTATEHVDDYGNPIHPPPAILGDSNVADPADSPLPADLQDIADLLWESAQGAPPIDRDPIAIHFRDHAESVVGCRLCAIQQKASPKENV